MRKLTWEEVLKEANRRGQTINKIMELHAPEQIFDDWYCTHCLEHFDHGTDQAPYPCETVKIINNQEPR